MAWVEFLGTLGSKNIEGSMSFLIGGMDIEQEGL